MNEQRLMEIKVRADHATDGPWIWASESTLEGYDESITDFGDDISDRNAQFIAEARSDVPELVAEVERLQADLEQSKKDAVELYNDNLKWKSRFMWAFRTLDRVELAEAKARVELEEYQNSIDYKELLTFAKKYGCSFINTLGELIICHITNTYASLHDCKTLEDIEAKVLMAVCRPIGKGLTKKHANIQLRKFNAYFKSDLTVDDMRLIYGELCYSHKLQENKDFIRNGFPMHELAGTPHE